MNGFKALIFDVDGTLAETEEIHRRAFNETFVSFGLDWHWSVELYAELLLVTGGKERMRHFAAMRQPETEISDERLAELHRYKTTRFGELIAAGACALRLGIADVLNAAVAQKQRLAIATTTSRDNVDASLRATLGRRGLDLFDPIVAGEDVADKKPAPEVYVKALDLLGLPAHECLAIKAVSL